MRLIPPRARVEKSLHASGFAWPVARHILCTQLWVVDISLALGVVCVWFSLWPLAFACGAVIALYNFWFLTKSIQACVKSGFRAKTAFKVIIGLNIRIGLTAVVLYFFIVTWAMPLVPLLFGLSSALISIMVWGTSRPEQVTACKEN